MLFGKNPIISILSNYPDVILAKPLLSQISSSFLKERVSPVKGSIVLCDLVFGEFHSGVYIGDHEIVNLEGDGSIEIVTPEGFLNRIGGLTNAKAIYVSCDEVGDPVGKKSIATRALTKVGSYRDYHLLFDNCHQFTSGCITGNFENADNFTWMLKMTVKQHLGAVNWLLWDEYDEVNDGVLTLLESLNDMIIY